MVGNFGVLFSFFDFRGSPYENFFVSVLGIRFRFAAGFLKGLPCLALLFFGSGFCLYRMFFVRVRYPLFAFFASCSSVAVLEVSLAFLMCVFIVTPDLAVCRLLGSETFNFFMFTFLLQSLGVGHNARSLADAGTAGAFLRAMLVPLVDSSPDSLFLFVPFWRSERAHFAYLNKSFLTFRSWRYCFCAFVVATVAIEHGCDVACLRLQRFF